MRIRPVVRQLVVAGFGVLIGSPASRAQTPAPHPDFSGEWVMDSLRSQRSDPVLVALRLTVSTRADTVIVVSDGTNLRNGTTSAFSMTMRVAANGTPTAIAPPARGGPALTGTLSWDGATMVIALSGDAGGNPVTIVQRWSLDSVGTTLTRHQRLSVGGREIVEALVFSRPAQR